VSDQHLDIQKMAVSAFAEHQLTRERGFTWCMKKPRGWNYGFRITWAPGAIIVTGDLGELVFRGLTTLWDGPWDAARFLVDCDYDYLMGKTNAVRAFDRDETVKLLISNAEESRRHGGQGWSQICKYYSETWACRHTLDPQKVTDHMRAAKALREDTDLDAGRVWQLDGDGDSCVYSYEPGTRWRYEALMLWAKAVIPSEPLSSKLARALRKFRQFRRDLKHYPILYRPERWTTGSTFNGCRYWTVKQGQHGPYYSGLRPFKILGSDLSRFGLWRSAGSGWSNNDDRYTFRRVEDRHAPAGSAVHA
jgi:hypothetical protein